MNTENIFSNEGQLESGESRDAEKEKLDDATHEPRSFVEQSGDYQQAEDIQKTLESLPLEDENTVLGRMPGVRDDLSDVAVAGSDDEKNEATPINLPGPEAAEDEEDMQLISGPNRDDLPDGTGILEIPHETVEMANPFEDEDTVLGRMPEVRDDLSDVTLAGSEDEKDEATPINLPGPEAAVAQQPDPSPDPFDGVDVALSPDDVKKEDVSDLPIPVFNEVDGNVEVSPIPVPLPNPGDTGNIASEDDWESPNVNIAKGGNPVDPPPPPDLTGERELSPDDVKLEPAPDFEAMNEGERAVVDVIGKAIADEEYRAALFADTRAATSSHAVTEEDQTGLNEMTEESFNFFAAEVEARLAVAGEQQTLAQVVHSVWRDLNPGGLVYVLTFKIPQYHLV